MRWTESGFIISRRKHGEASMLIELFSREHGRHAGLVRGGTSKRLRALVEPGNLVRATWRARLAEHLGWFVIEGEWLCAGQFMGSSASLAALNTLNGEVALLPERDPHPNLFDSFQHIMKLIAEGRAQWAPQFVIWELQLLSELGFGLDLTQCAVTGTTDKLTHVSPKTGRAVSQAIARPYIDKLLPLPSFLINAECDVPSWPEVDQGFALTDYFFTRYILQPNGLSWPPGRARLREALIQIYGATRQGGDTDIGGTV